MKPNFKCILLVEDDETIRCSMKEALECEGYQVIEAWNGLVALEILKKIKPNLILLDMRMPVMNGREFLTAKALVKSIAGIPVIVVSATASGDDLLGSVAFIQKPLNLDALYQKVFEYI